MGRHEKTPGNFKWMILEIHLPIPRALSFDYRAPNGRSESSGEQFIGRRVLIPFGFRPAVGVITRIKDTSDAPPEKIKNITEMLDSEPILTPEMLDLGRWLSERYACSLGEALFSLMPPGKGNPSSFKDPDSETHFDEHPSWNQPESMHLTGEQTTAIRSVHDAIYHHSSQAFLLYGVAAAGKTEVYMAAIRDVMAQGKNALVLVPEIGLATQMAEDLTHRFGEKTVLLWHSDVQLKKRVQDWWRMKRGEFHIVVGPMSAAVAPIPNLGVVIVDEEHDVSYKNDRKPRFHARDVALYRAKKNDAVAIFGSATPSLELMQAAKEGELTLLELLSLIHI